MLIAITRPISSTINRCELTHLARTPIDLPRAISQHDNYEQCLAEVGCQVIRLPAMPECPDAVFVEDTCIAFDELAIIARPGATSRLRETTSVMDAMKPYRRLYRIEAPGTLDGGDVLCMGRKVFVGRSTRSNPDGIAQLRDLLAPHGYVVIAVEMAGGLHLKSAVTIVAARTILVNSSWVDPAVFGADRVIVADENEPAAANGLLIGTTMIYSTVFPKTQMRLVEHGIKLLTVDMSELAKAEGAISCCSVVFESNSLG
jgi:dimethylargininase